MLVTLPNKNPFFSSPMPKNPKSLRERLFEGIDKDYNVSNLSHISFLYRFLKFLHVQFTKEFDCLFLSTRDNFPQL